MTTKRYDVAIIGAGPAGANAALSATKCGCQTIVIDEQHQAGGQVWRAKSAAITAAPPTPETQSGDALRNTLAKSNVVHLAGARVWQIERESVGWVLHVLIAGRTKTITTKALIIATGAREFVQPVPGWTTPGVIGLAGATALFKQDMTLPGQRTIVSGTGPLVFFVASEIRRLGGTVAAVVTPNSCAEWLRATPSIMTSPTLMWRGARWIADLMLAGVPILWGHAVGNVIGDNALTAVDIFRLESDGSPAILKQRMAADSLCLGNGLISSIEASQLAGVELVHRPELGGWVPQVEADGSTQVKGVFVCGDGAGIRGAAAAQIHGTLAGMSAAAFIGRAANEQKSHLLRRYKRAAKFGMAMTKLSALHTNLQALTTAETIVCRCESLTRFDIAQEIASGAQSINALKSGRRAGMGPCGGQFCQTAIARLIAISAGCDEADIPPSTARPPLRPVLASSLAGDVSYADIPIPKPAPL